MRVKDVLDMKGRTVYSIDRSATVWQALDQMVRQNVSSLLVLDDDRRILGIISDRDVLRRCIYAGWDPKETGVMEAATTRLVCVASDDDVASAQDVMTRNRIRHLPVVDGDSLAGLISIGDLVKATLQGAQTENRYLMDYITAKYPG
jgi:CBS domain-containing protein